MAFVTMLHLQASADAALSCKPGRPVPRGGHVFGHFMWIVFLNSSSSAVQQFFKVILLCY